MAGERGHASFWNYPGKARRCLTVGPVNAELGVSPEAVTACGNACREQLSAVSQDGAVARAGPGFPAGNASTV